jgi:hypothetical protein
MYEQYDQKEAEPTNQKDWERLADTKCPLCSLELLRAGDFFKCTCGFTIHTDRLNQIQREQQDRRLSSEHRKKLADGKKVKFKSVKTMTEDTPRLSIKDLLKK